MEDIMIYPRNHPDLSTDNLSDAEDVLQVNFPSSYKKFQTDYGGGFAWPKNILLTDTQVIEKIGSDKVSIFEFYAPDLVLTHAKKEIYGGSTPEPFVFIADANGLELIISLRESDYGSCFIWLPTAAVPWGEDYGNGEHNDDRSLIPLATNFKSLLESITDLALPGPGRQNWERGALRDLARLIEI